MNQKQIGLAVIILAFVVFGAFYYIKVQQDRVAFDFTKLNNGSCVTEEGVCLHDQSSTIFFVGFGIAMFLLALGVYLIYFDKTQQVLVSQHKEVSTALKEAKRSEHFDAFLKGFSADEQTVLKAIKEQDGIQQSTLRYRTGMSKTTLSLMLKSFEERGYITKEAEGKTNKIHLKKVY